VCEFGRKTAIRPSSNFPISLDHVLRASQEGDHPPLNPPAWIANLHPQVVLLSVAPGDRQGLSSPQTLESVQGYTLLRTDRSDWIEITTDGENLWVEVERK